MKNSVRFLNLDILSLTQKELLEQMAEGVLYTPQPRPPNKTPV